MKQPKKQNLHLFLTPPTENPVPKSKMFFFSVQTRTLQETFVGTYSSLAYSSGELPRVIANYSGRQWETHAFSDLGVKMFLGHKFGSRHARRSNKGFIDAGDYPVFKKGLNQNFGPLDWRPGPVKFGPRNKHTSTFWDPPRRTPHPNQNQNFLIEPRSLAASVEGVNNSLAKVAGEL